jgi:allantoin racemase
MAKCKKVMEEKGTEAVILGCTIIAASMEKWLIDTKAPRELTILNTNTFSLKMAETLADLKKQGLYDISRSGYYQKPQQRNARELAEVRARYGRPSAF